MTGAAAGAMHDLIAAIGTGGALGLSAGVSPGPLTTLLIGESLRHGRTAGLRVACVPLLSDLPVVLLAVLLLAGLRQVSAVLGSISLAGGAFLLYLAYDSARAVQPTPPGAGAPPSTLLKGVLTNWANPHPYLFWMTVGAPLLLRPGSVAAATMFVVAFYLGLVGAKVGMALLVARVRQVLLGAWYVWLNRLLAVALLALAVLLLRDGLALLTQG